MSDKPSAIPSIDKLAPKTDARGLAHFPGRLAEIRREARVSRASHRIQLNLRADSPEGLLAKIKPIVAKLEAAIADQQKPARTVQTKAHSTVKNPPDTSKP